LRLKSALADALAYRQKCISLQKEISQLREVAIVRPLIRQLKMIEAESTDLFNAYTIDKLRLGNCPVDGPACFKSDQDALVDASVIHHFQSLGRYVCGQGHAPATPSYSRRAYEPCSIDRGMLGFPWVLPLASLCHAKGERD
jgi:hypothetical protein